MRIGMLSRRDDNNRMDIFTVPGPGLAAQVERYDGITKAMLDSFFAYDDDFKSGTFVAGS